MNSFVLVDFFPNVDVNYPQYSLTEYPHETYSIEVSTSLWQDDECILGAIHWEDTVPEGRLDQVNGPVPVPCVRVLIPRYYLQSFISVFFPHP